MGDMSSREIAYMRDVHGIDERGGSLDYDEPCMDGAPETTCPLCCEELPEPDGECADPMCKVYTIIEEEIEDHMRGLSDDVLNDGLAALLKLRTRFDKEVDNV